MARQFEFTPKDDSLTLKFVPTGGECTAIIRQDRWSVGEFEEYRLLSYSDLLSRMIQTCVMDYMPKGGKFAKIPEKYREHVITEWRAGAFNKKSCMILSKAFKEEWSNLLTKANPKIVELDRALIRATGFKPKFSKAEKFYKKVLEQPYAFEDCVKYIPATLFHFNTYYVEGNRPKDWDDWDTDHKDVCYADDGNDWKDYYAGGEAYRALNQTLMAMKFPLAWDILIGIRKIKLARPIFSKAELSCVLYAASHCYSPEHKERLLKLLYAADFKQIKKLACTINKSLPKKSDDRIDLRKSRNQYNLLGYISDYLREHNYNGTLLGAYKRSKEWHDRIQREQEQRRREDEIKWAEEHKAELLKITKKPPFDITKLDPAIKFLDSVQAIYDEGKLMGHCVHSYRWAAVQGHCYLFHIQKDKDMATLELGDDLSVKQCQGVHNAKNTATKWATNYFTNFINKWKKEQQNARVIAE